MSQANRGGRFSYLTSTAEDSQTEPQSEAGRGQETERDLPDRAEDSRDKTDSSGGEEGRSRTSAAGELASVPKGQGRMKQKRSQLNVRIPTTLKRQASAKAVLEGRDIGEVIEKLLHEYLER